MATSVGRLDACWQQQNGCQPPLRKFLREKCEIEAEAAAMEADLRLESSLWVGNKRYQAVLTGWHFNWTEVDKKNRDKKTSRRLHLQSTSPWKNVVFVVVLWLITDQMKWCHCHLLFCLYLNATSRLQPAPRTGFWKLCDEYNCLKKCAAAGGKRAEQVKQHRHEMQFTVHTGRRARAHGDVSQGLPLNAQNSCQAPPHTHTLLWKTRTKDTDWQAFIKVCCQSGLLSIDTNLVLLK